MNSKLFSIYNTSVSFFILAAIISASGETTDENLSKLAAASNEFALNLHRQLTVGSEKNVFFSPLSLSTIFGMLYYGVRGDSAKELREVLGYQNSGLSDESVHSTFHHLLSKLSNSSNEYILKSANTILVDEDLDLRPEYKTDVQDLYLSPIVEVNFRQDGPQIVDNVNKWVNAHTEGKIKNILRELNGPTVMVLLNAVYFKGKWKFPFRPSSTKPSFFYNGGLESKAKIVPMMHHRTKKFRYTNSADFQALELPYVGEHLSMLILLPSQRDGLSALEESLTVEKLDAIRQKMTSRRRNVYLPKFRIEFKKNLVRDLKQLGITKIFNEGSEDFSGISEKYSKKISVKSVIHKSVIEVNEEGTEAAAATSIFMFIQAAGIDFKADHPFIFFIVDKRNGLILFMGRVSEL